MGRRFPKTNVQGHFGERVIMRIECSSTAQLLDMLDKAEWVRAVDSTMEVETGEHSVYGRTGQWSAMWLLPEAGGARFVRQTDR